MPITLGWSAHDGRDSLLIAGIDPGAVDQLVVRPSALVRSRAALPPVAGRFWVVDPTGDTAPDTAEATPGATVVHFVPRFGFLRGTAYTLLAGERVVGELVRPGPAGDAETVVHAIYPDTEQVPLNLLRMYLHFSRPMSEGQAQHRIKMHRVRDGAVLDGVFLAAQHELWDQRRQRLTLLLDPGRIKRGLVPNTALGYPLTEGEPIEIRVDPGFVDAGGLPLQTAAARRYHVGPAVRQRADPAAWRLTPPPARTLEPLRVSFDRPLDRALLGRCLTVVDAAWAPVAGTLAIGPGDASWLFTPTSPWGAGRHALVIDSSLEDLAGNSVARVFDRDLTKPTDRVITAQQISLDFNCTPDSEPRW